MPRPLFKTLVLVGTGLIGASFGRDVRRCGLAEHVVGLDSSPLSARRAKRLGAIDRIGRDWHAELAAADLVVLAIPVRAIRVFLKEHADAVSPRALVMDVGSTKRRILADAERTLGAGRFIGCHPMAGREKSGPEASRDGLFADRTCFLVPARRVSRSDIRKVATLWRKLGARPVLIGADKHDKVLSGISHVPHAAAFALVASVAGDFKRHERLKDFLGGGFLDTTRVAGSSPVMWRDIFLENDRNVLNGLQRLRGEIEKLEKAIRRKDGNALTRYLEKVSRLRRSLS